jgi:glutamine amidotransferase
MAKPGVAIIDGGGANLASLVFALDRLGADSVVTSDADVIGNATHVILPGVGAAAAAMRTLRHKNLVETIKAIERPFLGICLGMQLLGAGSDEDDASCLAIVPDRASRLPASPGTPVPNMGWCPLEIAVDHPLLEGIDNGAWFYFVHSYAMPVSNHVIATARHSNAFAAVLASGNFYGTQFHPERSSSSGARLLSNFLDLT